MTDDQLIAKVDKLIEMVARLEKRFGQMSVSGGGHANVAPDSDLDGPHGDPVMRKDPKRWNADVDGSYVGCHFSECPPDYLDAVAGFKEWQAQQDERKGTDDDKRKAKFNRLDAARARGWAQRLRSGYRPLSKPAHPDEGDVPF